MVLERFYKCVKDAFIEIIIIYFLSLLMITCVVVIKRGPLMDYKKDNFKKCRFLEI